MKASQRQGIQPWLQGVPDDWELPLLRLVARVESGHTPSRSHPEYWVPAECTVPWFSLADIWQLRDGNQKYLGETSEMVSEAGLANSSARLLPAGTVVLSRTASVGFSGIMRRPMATTQDFVNFVCGKRLLPDFLLWVLRGMTSEFEALQRGSTHQTIYMSDLVQFRVPLPSLEAQRAIAELLDRKTAAIDALIEKKERSVALLSEKRGAAIQGAVTRGLDPGAPTQRSPFEWIREMPAHWSLVPVYAHFDVQLGKMLNPHAASGDHLAPYLRNTNIQWDRIDLDDLKEMSFSSTDRTRFALQPGDVLVCEGGEVGRAAVWTGARKECFYQKALHRVRAKADRVSGRFLMYSLWGAALAGHFEDGNRSTIAHLTAEKLRVHRIPWPPLAEQRRIVAWLDRSRGQIDLSIGTVERQVLRLREYRQSLITAAVTGQLAISA